VKRLLTLLAFASAATFSGLSNAMLTAYDITYSGWWEAEGGGSLLGTLVSGPASADDGIIDLATELESWSWDWSGNSFVSPFSISSNDAGAGVSILGTSAGFYVDGTPNLPDFTDGLDQGIFIGGSDGEFVVDLEFLLIEDNTVAFPFGGDATFGDVSSQLGMVSVGDPRAVPEPLPLTLLAFAIPGFWLSRRRLRQSAR